MLTSKDKVKVISDLVFLKILRELEIYLGLIR